MNLVAVGLSAELWFMFGGCADAGGSRFSLGLDELLSRAGLVPFQSLALSCVMME